VKEVVKHIMNNGPKLWYSEFLGVGYRYHDIYMNVLLLFSDRSVAVKLWNRSIDGWADDQVKLMFIEDGGNYWFILFQEGSSLLLKENIGFIKCVPISNNYVKFKQRYELKVIIRFAIYSTGSRTNKKENVSYDLRLMKKMKYAYGVEFLQYDDVPKYGIAYEGIGKVKYSAYR
jgi:hypothetical protein